MQLSGLGISTGHVLNRFVFGCVALLLCATLPASAETSERYVENPPLLELQEKIAPATLMALPSEIDSGVRGERKLNLNIVYTEGYLYNPVTRKRDTVRLRSYTGSDTNPHRPYVAPSIEVEPGDTVRITLNNKLPTDPSCTQHQADVNTPHCFNGTNLHSHGLWVSPTGNSDNVLLKINPGVSFQYEYNLPPDHPAGTFWYHTHLHGSTALQVSSGMAGALIVRGERVPTLNKNGDIDTLLKGKNFRERVLVLQQIQYACLDKQGKVLKDKDGNVIWTCPADVKDPVYGIESYDQFGPGSWETSGRYTSINGRILPTFVTKAGVIERWRMIHAGVRNTISLEFRKLKSEFTAESIDGLKASEADRFIGENCTGEPIPHFVVANDGLTRAAAWKAEVTTLQPGYRADALVVFPEAGHYCVIDTSAPAPASVSQANESRQLLGVARVTGAAIQNVEQHLEQELIAAARKNMPRSIKAEVIADLQAGLKFSKFIPHPDIAETEVMGTQELTFFIDTTTPNTAFEVSNHIGSAPGKPGKPIDPHPYDPDRVDRLLTLGGVDEWTMQSQYVSHPFHIHVNPFQIVKILDPHGQDVSAPDAIDDGGGCLDTQFRGLKGVWKDTLWIKSLLPPGKCQANMGSGLYTAVVRTRYQRYIGEFVLHCHILDHEDQGMMQNVSIGLPNGQGGTVAPGHH